MEDLDAGKPENSGQTRRPLSGNSAVAKS